MNINASDVQSNFRQAVARAESGRNRTAELNAQTRRLDKDRLIFAALDEFERNAKTRGYVRGVGSYLGGAAGIETRHTEDAGNVYVLELLAEIRASLSPLVR